MNLFSGFNDRWTEILTQTFFVLTLIGMLKVILAV